MPTKKSPLGFLSGNVLKIIGAVLMLCDHAGMLLFPDVMLLRYVGRLAFPIFAYLIAEGAKHTKSRPRYLLTMGGFALVIQICYFLLMQSLEMSVLVTFTLSLVMIFALDFFKAALFTTSAPRLLVVVAALLFAASVASVALLDRVLDLDYHFFGCLLPLFPALLTTPRVPDPPAIFRRLDTKLPRLLLTAVGILCLSLDCGGIQHYSFFALPLLLFYSEERGRWKMKYFFYLFYPLHLVALYGIAMLLK